MSWIWGCEQAPIICFHHLNHFILLYLPNPIFIDQPLYIILPLSLTSSLVKEFGVFVSRREPNSLKALPPKNLLMIKELIDFPTYQVDSVQVVCIINSWQVLEFLLFCTQLGPRIPTGITATLQHAMSAFFFFSNKQYIGLTPWLGFDLRGLNQFLTVHMCHPLFFKPLHFPSSSRPTTVVIDVQGNGVVIRV